MMNQWYEYYSALACRVLEYIKDETADSHYYQELSKMAPNPEARELLAEFARDEAQHAANFRQVYRQITGEEAKIPPTPPPKIPSYCQALKRRILAESNDFVKYGEEFLNAPDMYLRNLFYLTGATEAKHGMRIPILLCTEECCEEEEEEKEEENQS